MNEKQIAVLWALQKGIADALDNDDKETAARLNDAISDLLAGLII